MIKDKLFSYGCHCSVFICRWMLIYISWYHLWFDSMQSIIFSLPQNIEMTPLLSAFKKIHEIFSNDSEDSLIWTFHSNRFHTFCPKLEWIRTRLHFSSLNYLKHFEGFEGKHTSSTSKANILNFKIRQLCVDRSWYWTNRNSKRWKFNSIRTFSAIISYVDVAIAINMPTFSEQSEINIFGLFGCMEPLFIKIPFIYTQRATTLAISTRRINDNLVCQRFLITQN